MNSFLPINLENIKDVEKYFKLNTSGFCDFTPFVALMWQELYKNEFMICDSVLYLKYVIDGHIHYSILTDTPSRYLDTLKSIDNSSSISLSLVSESGLIDLKKSGVHFQSYTDEGWWDYIYSGDDMRSLVGKRYAGQRNHINKFMALYPDFKYEKVTSDNVSYVADFFDKIVAPHGNEVQSFETIMVKKYLRDYKNFETLGGFVRSQGEIVSFAFGEIQNDMLYVHIEKADRNIQGSYPIIVREFARANPTRFINREEDMGIEGLRISKKSLHPINTLKKYSIKISDCI